MVSITNLTASQASNYYQKDSYYIKTQGEWQGKGAKELGLTGKIDKSDFDNLVQGIAPNGEFEITSGGEEQNHRAGVDLTFSAPKSVSIASEVLGDTRITDAHEKAVTETLKWVEENYSQARQTQDGLTRKIDTDNLIIAKFQHNVSRELDPQLHTHAVIMNITKRPDGEWRALSNEAIYQNKLLIGQIYRNELAKNLTTLGFQLETNSKGFFEIKGIENSLLEHFSQRSNQIKEKVSELREKLNENINESKLKEFATLDSRQSKRDVNIDKVREQWKERLERFGYRKEDILQSISQGKPEKSINNEYDYVRQAVSILTENESTFSREKALLTASRLSLGNHTTSQLSNAFDELIKNKEIKKFDNNIFSTKEMQKIEKNIVNIVLSSQRTIISIANQKDINQGIQKYEIDKGFSLSFGQKEAVSHILTSQDRFIAIQGDAGTGKTTVLDAVNRIAQEYGYTLRGLAQTGKASDEIEKASGIKSQTISSFLVNIENKIKPNEIWVVDEASMLGSRKMNELIKIAKENNARVVLMGDTKQLQSIEAGGIFEKLQEKGISTVKMSEVQRQKDASYLLTVRDFSERRFDQAMLRLQEKERIHKIADRQERINAIVEKYTQDYKNTILVTATNKDKQELNQKIRNELKKQGEIGEYDFTFTVRESRNLSEEQKQYAQSFSEGDILIQRGKEYRVLEKDISNHILSVQDKNGTIRDFDLRSSENFSVFYEKEQSFSVGEKIVFLKNDKGLKVKNGQTAIIENIDETGKITLTMESGEQKNINIFSQYNYIEQGYAVTDYKSQGQTEKSVIYHADTSKEINYNQVYVAMTRGKYDCQIFTDNIIDFTELMKKEQIKTSTLNYEKENGFRQNEQNEINEKGIFEIEENGFRQNEQNEINEKGIFEIKENGFRQNEQNEINEKGIFEIEENGFRQNEQNEINEKGIFEIEENGFRQNEQNEINEKGIFEIEENGFRQNEQNEINEKGIFEIEENGFRQNEQNEINEKGIFEIEENGFRQNEQNEINEKKEKTDLELSIELIPDITSDNTIKNTDIDSGDSGDGGGGDGGGGD